MNGPEFQQQAPAMVEACLLDPAGRGLTKLWRLLWVTFGGGPGVGEHGRRMAWLGMKALIWHPAFPVDLGYDAIYVGAGELPATAHWWLACQVNPELEERRLVAVRVFS